jgi:hypothetical protein
MAIYHCLDEIALTLLPLAPILPLHLARQVAGDGAMGAWRARTSGARQARRARVGRG